MPRLADTGIFRSNAWVAAFFLCFLILGLFLHRDYGACWDEKYTHSHGQQIWKFLFEGDPALLTAHDRFYGPFIEAVLTFVTHWIGTSTIRQDLFLRHAAVFVIFFIGTVCFYRLSVRRHGGRAAGLFSVLLLLLSPRIFADAFYNSKDVGFLAVFIAAVLTMERALEKPSASRLAVHAVVSAAAISTRLAGLLIPALTAFFLLVDMCRRTDRKIFTAVRNGLLYMVLVPLLTVAFWPTLWHDPIGGFVSAVREMGHFTKGPDGVLYRGEFVTTLDIPWHYLPTWIAITTPIFHLFCSAWGICLMAARWAWGSDGLRRRSREDITVLAWLIVPVLLVIFTGSPVYDGWRHFYFVYPAIVLLAVDGWMWVLNRLNGRALKSMWAAISAAAVLPILLFMVQSHPLQNVYFNLLAGPRETIAERYEVDYWGLSYREGLEYIARIDPRRSVLVSVSNPPGEINWHLASPWSETRRLRMIAQPGKAHYFLTNYREGPLHRKPPARMRKIREIKVGGVTVLGIYQ